ncbi:MAG: Mbeg1-like protein [Pseudomonadota bacterium]
MVSLYELADIANDIYGDEAGSRSFTGWSRTAQNTFLTSSGFCAGIYECKERYPRALVLAFRGTDTKRGKRANDADWNYGNYGNFLIGTSTQAVEALAIWENVARKSSRDVYLSGHSLGGALVSLAAIGRRGYGDMRMAGGATFCAPGVSLASSPSEYFRDLKELPILNVLIHGDDVSAVPGMLAGRRQWMGAPYKDKHSIDHLWKMLGWTEFGRSSLRDAYLRADDNRSISEVFLAIGRRTASAIGF